MKLELGKDDLERTQIPEIINVDKEQVFFEGRGRAETVCVIEGATNANGSP